MPIQLLEQHVAELIAAGEVVERPSSVVKELVENAIDAGATSIRVDIERGGIQKIRIQDNGAGIDREEVPLAFLRHATSKVRTQKDLDAIGTLGFRGEALASIASVSQVELCTKRETEKEASAYRIAGGKEIGLEETAHPNGTTITVENLFYNTPARMKFLKKDASEAGFVTETLTRLALSRPEIAFQYTKDGKQIFASTGDGQLKSAAYSVLGPGYAKALLPVERVELPYGVYGLVTKPEAARASRTMQYFYINKRFVKNKTMMAALEQAYKGTTMQGKFPGCILFLAMPPELVDVNVHPAKTEVRFANEKDVFHAVYQAVKAAIQESYGQHSALELEKPVPEEVTQEIPLESTPVTYMRSAPAYHTKPVEFPRHVEERALDIEPDPDPEPAPEPEQIAIEPLQDTQTEKLRFIGEVFETYILAEKENVLCIIDKHAAHERLLYEKLVQNRQEPDVQMLLTPVVVNLGAGEKNALLENEEILLSYGVELDDFGAGSVAVRGVPADIDPGNIETMVQEMGARLATGTKSAQTEKREWVLHSIACRAAIKAGDKTAPEQLLHLAQEIINGNIPPFCPHGRPVLLEITDKELEKQFGRLG